MTADVLTSQSFIDLAPQTKRLIVARARRKYEMEQVGDARIGAELTAEVAALEAATPRYPVPGGSAPVVNARMGAASMLVNARGGAE